MISQIYVKHKTYQSDFFDSGSMRTFKFPPTMFMTKRKNPRTEVLTALGKISTIAMKRMPNQVSAEIAKVK